MTTRNPAGRPSIFTSELADKICDLIATSEHGTATLCQMHDWMPDESSIRLWRFKDEQFSLKYIQAKRFQAELFAESTLRIAEQKATYFDSEGNERVDAGHVAWQKLNINTRQWHASKLAPKIYGDKQQSDTTVTIKHEDDLKQLS